MANIDTILPFPFLLFEKSGWRGISLDVLVVRGSFTFFNNDAPMQLAKQQSALAWGDRYLGPVETDPMAAVLAEAGDLVVGKPGTDIILSGHVSSPHGVAVPDWVASVQVGQVRKQVRVTGPRHFVWQHERWQVTPAKPVSRVALDYRLALGGRLLLPDDRGLHSGLIDLSCPTNPAGIGWLPDQADLAHLPHHAQARVSAWLAQQRNLPAPQFEAVTQALQQPYDRAQPEGFGPIARWWQPRTALQGTLDAKWQAERYPAAPDDYDPRYLHSAHPELISAEPLQGDETIRLDHCLPEPQFTTRLPGLVLQAMTRYANGTRRILPMMLDTVCLDLDQRLCTLTWRTLFHRNNPARDISLIAMPIADWQYATARAGVSAVPPAEAWLA
jgi:hypothetical protein